jgi:hypothetical protein
MPVIALQWIHRRVVQLNDPTVNLIAHQCLILVPLACFPTQPRSVREKIRGVKQQAQNSGAGVPPAPLLPQPNRGCGLPRLVDHNYRRLAIVAGRLGSIV